MNNIWDAAAIFLSATITVAYELLSKAQDTINKRHLLLKLVGAILVSFFIVPGVMEYFKLSLKIGLLITVVITYGLDELLKKTIKRVGNEINNKDINKE